MECRDDDDDAATMISSAPSQQSHTPSFNLLACNPTDGCLGQPNVVLTSRALVLASTDDAVMPAQLTDPEHALVFGSSDPSCGQSQ